MKIRLAIWSLPVLSLIVVLGCTPRQTQSDTPPTQIEASGESEETAFANPFSNEVYVLVGTSGNTFTVSPEPVYVYDRKQKVIWVAEDSDVLIEIEFKPAEQNTDNPRVQPPGKPCETPARKCGTNPIGGNVGKFLYTVKGSRGGQPLDDFDPLLEILY